MGWHVPAMSPLPHLAESGYEQNCFSGQRKPAKPPHILAAGGVAEPAAAGVDGAVAGGGAELTTPVGVSIGSALAVGVAVAAVGAAVAVGACAPAAGVDCEEQPASALNDTIATHTSTRFGFVMRQH